MALFLSRSEARLEEGSGTSYDPEINALQPIKVQRQFRLLTQQDAHARVQGQTDRRNIAFRWPPVLRNSMMITA